MKGASRLRNFLNMLKLRQDAKGPWKLGRIQMGRAMQRRLVQFQYSWISCRNVHQVCAKTERENEIQGSEEARGE